MMTRNEILTYICKLLQASPINGLSGGIYKDKRPTDSVLEDTVVHMFNGVSGKFLSDGSISIKIFYPDIQANNSFYVEDTARGQILESLLIDFSETLFKNYTLSFDKSTREHYTEGVEERDEHFAILKLNYLFTQN